MNQTDQLKTSTAPEAAEPIGVPAKLQPVFPVHKSVNRFHVHVHTNRKVWVGLLIIVLAVFGGLVCWSQSHKTPELAPATAQRHINDPNYSIDLPIGWQPTSDYKQGADLSTFYNTASYSGMLAIYVLPIALSNEPSASHTAAKISELSPKGSPAEVLSTQSVQFGGTKGNITTVLGTLAGNSTTEKSCYVFANVDYRNVAYNLDLITKASDCKDSHVAALQKALQSFKPQTAAR